MGMVWPLKYPPPPRNYSSDFDNICYSGFPAKSIKTHSLREAQSKFPCVQILCFWTLSIVLSLSKKRPDYFSKHNVSETGFCLRLQVKPTQLGPIDRASPYLRTSIDWARMKRFYLKTGTESSLRKVAFWKIIRHFLDKDKTMDNVRKHNIRTNVTSSQTSGSYYQSFHFSEKYMAHITDDAISCKARIIKTIL
jgi:hypothetical protein